MPSSPSASVTAPTAAPKRAPASAPAGPAVRRRLPDDWLWRIAPVLVAAVGSVIYLIVAPRTVDLAAASYRADLFGREGFTIWNGNWYAGHHTAAYSVLYPPLGWLFGAAGLGAISAVASAALFEPIARRAWGEAGRWAALWFALGALTPVYAGRIPFAFGLAVGLGAVLALQRGRTAVAVVLAICTTLASPMAGLFLAMGAIAHVAVRRDRRSLAVAVAAGASIVLLAFAFPDPGREPFDLSTFWPLPLLCVAFYLFMPREERTLRFVALLYAFAGIAAYIVDNPVGGNAVRLAAIVGGPLLLGAVLARGWPSDRRRQVGLVTVLACLAFWQWSVAVRDWIKAFEDPSVEASYYRPLNRFLESQKGGEPFRVEIPFTRSHWEAAEVAPRFPLARGWLRQTDTERNSLFYDGVLNSFTYGTWLAERGVEFVALPSAKPDYSAYHERALIEGGLPYLQLVWRSKDWRVYRVLLPHRILVPDGATDMRLRKLGSDSADIDVRRPGEAVLRVRWTPYWRAPGACVEPAGEWTRVIARRPGRVHVEISFSPERLVSRGRRCS